MINSLVAYDITEVTKKLSLTKARTWFKAGMILEENWEAIQEKYKHTLSTPKIVMRVFLFFVTAFGILTALGPIALIGGFDGEGTWRINLLIVGAGALIFLELVMIKRNRHYKSGVTEACYYLGAAFTATALLGFELNSPLIAFIVALVICMVGAIRYHDLISIVAGFYCFTLILFYIFQSTISVLPFVVMLAFSVLFLVSQKLQSRSNSLLWEDHFILFDALALLMIYLGGNYFVVRELSVELMDVNLSTGENITFAWLFYLFTFIIPGAYLTWGLMRRKVIFIRMGLLGLALSIMTISFYYASGYYEFTITGIGLVMVLSALGLMKFLKKSRKGFTREQILTSKWDNSDLGALLASQTMGGHQMDEPEASEFGKGGKFGGGGASGDF